MPGSSVSEQESNIDFGACLLCESSIDVVVDLGNLVRRIDGNRWAFAFFDACEACHDVVYRLFVLYKAI